MKTKKVRVMRKHMCVSCASLCVCLCVCVFVFVCLYVCKTVGECDRVCKLFTGYCICPGLKLVRVFGVGWLMQNRICEIKTSLQRIFYLGT